MESQSDNLINRPPVDVIFKVPENIDTYHSEIHAGHHFYSRGYVDMLNGASYNIVMLPTVHCHFIYEILSTALITINLYEGSTGVSGGSQAAVINNNRNSSRASGMSVTLGATVSTPGSSIMSTKIGIASPASADRTGDLVREYEIVTKIGTYYQFNLVAGANLTFNYIFIWYEQDP